jgi:hypothetical protein
LASVTTLAITQAAPARTAAPSVHVVVDQVAAVKPRVWAVVSAVTGKPRGVLLKQLGLFPGGGVTALGGLWRVRSRLWP